jgi:hypothetical protein
MIVGHILGIPAEETALTFAPVILIVIARLRISSYLSRKPRRGAIRDDRYN